MKADVDLSRYEILERKAQCQTVIDILKDEEEFKVIKWPSYNGLPQPKNTLNIARKAKAGLLSQSAQFC